MAKIDIEIVKYTLQRNIPEGKVAEIMKEIELELQAEQEERELKPPSVKKQFVVLLSDNGGTLSEKDIVGWVLQIPEGQNSAEVSDKILTAAINYNRTPKGRRMPVQTIGEALEVVPAKLFKENDLFVKTKEPILAVSNPNSFPKF